MEKNDTIEYHGQKLHARVSINSFTGKYQLYFLVFLKKIFE